MTQKKNKYNIDSSICYIDSILKLKASCIIKQIARKIAIPLALSLLQRITIQDTDAGYAYNAIYTARECMRVRGCRDRSESISSDFICLVECGCPCTHNRASLCTRCRMPFSVDPPSIRWHRDRITLLGCETNRQRNSKRCFGFYLLDASRRSGKFIAIDGRGTVLDFLGGFSNFAYVDIVVLRRERMCCFKSKYK